jgi:hypothetical protein
VVAAPAPANTSPPVILGSPEQGQTLAATSGSWTNNPSALSYQWQRCDPGCANIAGATSRSYILAAGDIGASVRVTVTATNSGGSGRASSSGIGPIGPGLQQVKAALSKLLGLIKTRANIKRLLARNGLAVDFAAPSAGQLTVPWRAPKTTHTGKLRLIAAGRRGFSKRGTAKISIRLTAAGKRLLRHAARVRVKASGTFAPLREPPVTVREAFTLSAHR